MSIHHGAHPPVEGHPAQVIEPGHARPFEAAVERARETFSRFVDGERSAGIWPRDCAQHEGEVGHRTPQASRGTQCRPCECRFRVRYAADRRPEANYVAECSRIAQRTSGIGAADNGREPARQRDGGAARRSAACLRQVVGVVRRSEDLIERVGLADGDRARAPHPLDNNIVFGGDVIFIERRSKCSADAACFQQVLVRDWQTMQRAQRLLVRLHLIGLRGSVGGDFRHQSHDGINLRVYTLDLFQMRRQCFARRQLLGADQPGHLDCAQKTNGGSGGLSLQSALDEKHTSHSQ